MHNKAFRLHLGGDDEDGTTAGAILPVNVQDWVTLSQRVIPPTGQHLLFKVSRHEDSVGRVWTWMGAYVGATFAGENRGGYYAGIGVAFAERIASSKICEVLDDLLDNFLRDVMTNGMMTGSVDNWQPRGSLLDALGTVEFAVLPQDFTGVQPGKAKALQVTLADWSDVALGQKVGEILSSRDYMGASSVLLTNWETPPDRREFYDAASTATQNGARQRFRPHAGTTLATKMGLKRQPAGNQDEEAADLTALRKRLTSLERRVEELSHANEGTQRPRLYSQLQWITIGLVVAVLALQILLLGARIGH
jgi:hypothetical protein